MKKKSMAFSILLMVCSVVHIKGEESSPEHVFKLLNAGSDDGTAQREIATLLQDPETSMFATGIDDPKEGMRRIAERMTRRPFLLCYQDKKLVAGVSYTPRKLFCSHDLAGLFIDSPEGAYIAALFVDKQHRRQGIGKALMAHLVEVIKREQPTLTVLHLDTLEENIPAARFFEGLGARKIGNFYAKFIDKACIAYTYTVPNSK